MLTIAFSTFKEIYRKKVFFIINILTVIYLLLLGTIMHFMGKEMSPGNNLLNMIFDISSVTSILGFYFSSILISFLTVMLSIGMVSGEIENGTILTILTKPISRWEYILGKYLGTALLILIYSTVLYIAVILIPLLSGVSLIHTFGILSLIKGFFLFLFQPLTILALSLFGSTVFRTLTNGIIVISIYMLGNIGGIMEQIAAISNKTDLTTMGILSSLISPFEVVYRKMVFVIFSSLGSFTLFGGFGMTNKGTEPSVWMMVYTGIYLMSFIFLSIKLFQKKDIG